MSFKFNNKTYRNYKGGDKIAKKHKDFQLKYPYGLLGGGANDDDEPDNPDIIQQDLSSNIIYQQKIGG